MADRYADEMRHRYGRGDRGIIDRSGDEIRSWLGDDEAARRREMDERERWRERGHSRPWEESERDRSLWEEQASYSSGRAYGDAPYSWGGAYDRERERHRERERDWPGDRDTRDLRWSGTYSQEPPWRRESAVRRDPYEYTRTHGGPTMYERGERYGVGFYERDDEAARRWRDEGWRMRGPFTGRGPKGYQRSDERIQEEINDRLTAHGFIDASDIECRVTGGVATLTGLVDSRDAKRAAEDVAEDTAGVREVHNELRVRLRPSDEGVGRTSVLGLTEAQMQSRSAAGSADTGRPRTRS